MQHAATQTKAMRVGPYCRAISKGARGDAFDGRTRAGKFLTRCEAELLSQLGREASFGERLLIRRITRLMLQAELLDAKLASGEGFTGHDGRAYGGIQNAIRNALKDLGLKPAAAKAKTPTLAEIIASHAKGDAANGA